MRAAFWRFAHKRYQGRPLHPRFEAAAFSWFLFCSLVYGSALIAGWVPTSGEMVIGLLLLGIPLGLGILHRRIRIEALKGPRALYLKAIQTDR